MVPLSEVDTLELWLILTQLDRTDDRLSEAERALLYRLRKEGKIVPHMEVSSRKSRQNS
jgi:hypothetical protein